MPDNSVKSALKNELSRKIKDKSLKIPSIEEGLINRELDYDPSFVEGLKASAIGQLLGYTPEQSEDPSLAQSLAF